MRIMFLALAACLASPAHGADGAPPLALAAVPQLVGEGTVSTSLHDFAPSLSADGGTLYFTRTDSAFSRMTLMQSRWAEGRWQVATVLPFSGVWNDGDGVLSPDGQRYIFISNRPRAGQAAKADLDLWMATRRPDGQWGEPERLPDFINSEVNEVYPSIAADGTLYFGRAQADRAIYRSAWTGGRYQPPERLPFSGFSFAIAPDQRFGILGVPDANRGSDLYLVVRQQHGWSEPRRLDGPVNAPQADLAGSITPDGKTLLFVSTRPGTPPAWPRARPVTTAAEVQAELGAVTANGLRNIYSVDLSALPAGG